MSDEENTPVEETETPSEEVAEHPPWWELVQDDDPLDGIDADPPEDPLRDAHYDHLSHVLDEYFTEIKESMLERVKALYVQKNGKAPVTHDRYYGMGLHDLSSMAQLLTEDPRTRARQIYERYMHRMMIAQYRRGETLIHLATRKPYIVIARPNQLELNEKGYFQYALKDPETGLAKLVPAYIVESVSYVRCVDGKFLIPESIDTSSTDECCGPDPADRWVTEHGMPAPWVPENCDNT